MSFKLSVVSNLFLELFPYSKLDYQASSPDEKALVEACARLGLIYLNDNNDILKIRLRINRVRPVKLLQN